MTLPRNQNNDSNNNDSNNNAEEDNLFQLSQAYAHTRYVQAVQSRGSHGVPLKFNGMAFTAQLPPGDVEVRDWGANTWWQNTRCLLYTSDAADE